MASGLAFFALDLRQLDAQDTIFDLSATTLKINATDMHLDQMTPVRNFFIATSSWGYGSYFLYLLVGGMLTFAVQSSAAIMAITMTLCSTHVLPIDMGISLVLGENIGTTITSNIVALSASVQARRAALAHLVFNLFGVGTQDAAYRE